MISIALPHKDLPYYEDFLEEDKEWEDLSKLREIFMNRNRSDSKYPRLYGTG